MPFRAALVDEDGGGGVHGNAPCTGGAVIPAGLSPKPVVVYATEEEERSALKGRRKYGCQDCGASMKLIDKHLRNECEVRSHFSHVAECIISQQEMATRDKNFMTEWHAYHTVGICHMDMCEITVRSETWAHRADVKTPAGRVIEVQHSQISQHEVSDRETHYGHDMAWLFHLDPTQHKFVMFDDVLYSGEARHTFMAKDHSFLFARRPVYLDIGLKDQLVRVDTMFGLGDGYSGRTGTCTVMPAALAFAEIYGGSLRMSPEDAARGRTYCDRHLPCSITFMDWKLAKVSALERLTELNEIAHAINGATDLSRSAADLWRRVSIARGSKRLDTPEFTFELAQRPEPNRCNGKEAPNILSADQRQAVLHIISGKNLFIQGPAGSGKTWCVDAMVGALVTLGLVVDVVAPTNNAALLIPDGRTIHSYFNFKQWSTVAEWASRVRGVKQRAQICRQQKELSMGEVESDMRSTIAAFRRCVCVDVLIWDECSMIKPCELELADTWLKECRQRAGMPCGGVQMAICGDALQIPPVDTMKDMKGGKFNELSPMFFEASFHPLDVARFELAAAQKKGDATGITTAEERLALAKGSSAATPFEALKCKFVELKTNHRQKEDLPFIEALSAIRRGELGHPSLQVLEQRVSFGDDGNTGLMIDAWRGLPATPVVANRKESVSAINTLQLSRFKDCREFMVTMYWEEKERPSYMSVEDYDELIDKGRSRTTALFQDHVELRSGRKVEAGGKRANTEKDRAFFTLAIGAPVVVTITNKQEGLAKNALAKLISISANGDAVIRLKKPERDVEVKPVMLFETNQVFTGRVTMLPLAQASACTIHKCQGQTYTEGICLAVDVRDDSSSWPPSLGYTALTRATRLENLHIFQPGYLDSQNKKSLIKRIFSISARARKFIEDQAVNNK